MRICLLLSPFLSTWWHFMKLARVLNKGDDLKKWLSSSICSYHKWSNSPHDIRSKWLFVLQGNGVFSSGHYVTSQGYQSHKPLYCSAFSLLLHISEASSFPSSNTTRLLLWTENSEIDNYILISNLSNSPLVSIIITLIIYVWPQTWVLIIPALASFCLKEWSDATKWASVSERWCIFQSSPLYIQVHLISTRLMKFSHRYPLSETLEEHLWDSVIMANGTGFWEHKTIFWSARRTTPTTRSQ